MQRNTIRVFVAGASGAIGTRVVAQLIGRGLEVIGTARTPAHLERVATQGATPIALDLLDARAVREAVAEAEPDAIVHQATALADALPTPATRGPAGRSRSRRIHSIRLRCRQRARQTPRCGISTRRSRRPAGSRCATANFYGASNDGLVEPVRKRQFPIVGHGGGVSSFIHLDDAAAATVLALEHGSAGIYNIVDDDPAPVREWMPVLADVLGAQPPRRVPRWLARVFAGEAAVMMGTDSRGASNARAKRELGWEPRYASWRQGFPAAYASTSATAGRDAHPAATASHSQS